MGNKKASRVMTTGFAFLLCANQLSMNIEFFKTSTDFLSNYVFHEFLQQKLPHKYFL